MREVGFFMREVVRHYLYLGLLVIFIVILFLTIISFHYTTSLKKVPIFLTIFVKHHYFFMFFIAIFGVVFGSVTQFLTSKKFVSNKRKLDFLMKHFKNSLSKEERKIVEYLVKSGGACSQYELTKLETLNKLKVSRTLFNMENKELLKKERVGKINKVFLDKEIFEVFSNKN